MRGRYLRPPMFLPAFSSVLKNHDLSGKCFVKVDIKDAFYAMPLPRCLEIVSAFRWKGMTYGFRRLPMGLYASPAILQAMLTSIVRSVTKDGWVHVDDILLHHESPKQLHRTTIYLIRVLHTVGFKINCGKSHLGPARKINYCGLELDTTTDTYNVMRSKR